jgi:hypothetical protein
MHNHQTAAILLQVLNLRDSIAESDTLLEAEGVETSAFGDLLQDKVDLIPAMQGPGKSALFRIFVGFLGGAKIVAHADPPEADPLRGAARELSVDAGRLWAVRRKPSVRCPAQRIPVFRRVMKGRKRHAWHLLDRATAEASELSARVALPFMLRVAAAMKEWICPRLPG